MSRNATSRIYKAILTIVVGLLAASAGILGWAQQIKPGIGPAWRNIVIGKSSSEDVISILGEPNKTERFLFDTTYLYQESRYITWSHRIVIQQNTVRLIEENTLQYSRKVLLADLVHQYGPAYIVTWSREGAGNRIVAYPELGILADVLALPFEEAYVTKIIYFQPRTALRMYADFAGLISLTDPFPASDIRGPKDPWFGTSSDSR